MNNVTQILKFEDMYADAGKPLTLEQVSTFIEKKEAQKGLLTSLEDYYIGDQNILDKPQVDASMPCNRVVVNYCQVIADFYNTYLLGRPVQYKSTNEGLLKEVKSILEYNDAHEIDTELNLNANIFGDAVEQVYLDEKGDLRFTPIDYRQVVIVYERSVEKKIHSVIKYWKYNKEDTLYHCEVWSANKVSTYEMDLSFKVKKFSGEKAHPFGDVPFIEYQNNKYKLSSFSQVMTLQDAYNKLMSSEIDDYEGFVDSFLGIYNAAGTTVDDIAKMKQNRVLLLDGESKAEWLVKNCNPAQIEQIKNGIVTSIHKIACLPDLTDENFAGNTSGVAIKYKMVGAENLASKQERQFRKGLQRRMEFVTRYLNNMNTRKASYDYREIEITFNRNLIGADIEVAQLINLVGNRVPIANLASQLSFITDSDMAAIKKADAAGLSGTQDKSPQPDGTTDPQRVEAQLK